MQDYGISSASAMDLLQSWAKPKMYYSGANIQARNSSLWASHDPHPEKGFLLKKKGPHNLN